MKVVMDKTNMAANESLFSDFSDYLRGQQSEIAVHGPVTNLVGYFKALNACISKNVQPPFKYYRVPLDEPTFDVNMDTRVITVPPKFIQNGLGVQGDANAEIIIFKIDRLYDLMDLHRLVNDNGCWVQWSHSNGRVTGNSQVVLSDVYEEVTEVEVENENGEKEIKQISNPYIYAAWVLSSNITNTNGSVDFALRFFTKANDPKTGKDYIDYSVSTQKATCKVNPGLSLPVLGDDIVVENLQDLILSRPVYSGVINSMNGASPYIETNLEPGIYDLLTSGADYEKYDETFPNGIRKLSVEATSPDQKTIVYQWYSGLDLVYNPLTDEEAAKPENDGKLYGTKATSKDYYATTAGTYYCKIGNYDENSGTRWIDSASIEIPRASEIRQNPDKLQATFPIQTYSIQKNVGNITYVPLNFDVLGANGEVKYDWVLTDLAGNPISSAEYSKYGTFSGGTFVPKEGVECIVSVSATNHKNNTVSETIHATNAEGTTCLYRAMPEAPSQVTLSYTLNGAFMTASASYNAKDDGSISASANHKDEWYYQWAYSKNGSTEDVPSSFINQADQSKINMDLGYLLKKPTDGTTYTTYRIWCNVGHTVYAKNPSLKVVGDSKTSNVITLRVYADGTIEQVQE